MEKMKQGPVNRQVDPGIKEKSSSTRTQVQTRLTHRREILKVRKNNKIKAGMNQILNQEMKRTRQTKLIQTPMRKTVSVVVILKQKITTQKIKDTNKTKKEEMK